MYKPTLNGQCAIIGIFVAIVLLVIVRSSSQQFLYTGCTGLCPATNIRQIDYVSTLIDTQIGRLPVHTFDAEKDRGLTKCEAVLCKQSHLHGRLSTLTEIWSEISSWQTARSLLPANLSVDKVRRIVGAISNAQVTDVRMPPAATGSNLKLLLQLEGGQRALWKPQRMEQSEDAPDKHPCDGHERPEAEIAAFYLSILLNLRRVPIAVGRSLHVADEILPHMAKRSTNATFYRNAATGRWCFYGACHLCSKEEPVCANASGYLKGALMLWTHLPLTRVPSPFQYSHVPQVLRVETGRHYCEEAKRNRVFNRDKGGLFVDLLDAAVFDWLLGDADRHMHHVAMDTAYWNSSRYTMSVLLDNGRALRNGHADHVHLMAPVYQCCQISASLHATLKSFGARGLSSALAGWMSLDALYPALGGRFLAAIDRRLYKLLCVVELCIERYGSEHVLLKYSE